MVRCAKAPVAIRSSSREVEPLPGQSNVEDEHGGWRVFETTSLPARKAVAVEHVNLLLEVLYALLLVLFIYNTVIFISTAMEHEGKVRFLLVSDAIIC